MQQEKPFTDKGVAPLKHDPNCDCGICAYCNGSENKWGVPTNEIMMDLAELDTEIEIQREKDVEEYCSSLPWSPDTSSETKTLVYGNIRAFAAHDFRNCGINKLISHLGRTINKQANELRCLKVLLDGDDEIIVREHEAWLRAVAASQSADPLTAYREQIKAEVEKLRGHRHLVAPDVDIWHGYNLALDDVIAILSREEK